jgi:hypothetical protein
LVLPLMGWVFSFTALPPEVLRYTLKATCAASLSSRRPQIDLLLAQWAGQSGPVHFSKAKGLLPVWPKATLPAKNRMKNGSLFKRK